MKTSPCLILLLLAAVFPVVSRAQTPLFRAVAFYSTDTEGDHVLFAQDALKFFSSLANKDNFIFDSTTDWRNLNANYLNTVLTAGGRYVCGNPNSLMPVWSNQATPPGPLNYRQIQEVIAFIRSDKAETYVKRDPEFFTPMIDPLTGKVETFNGWVDTSYQPAPGSTPYPACWTSEFAAPSAAPAASGSPAASGAPAPSASAGAAVLEEVAQGIAFTNGQLTAPANQPFQIRFQNEDAGTPHDITIKDSTGAVKFKGQTFPGPNTMVYDVPALPAGTYPFVCSVHSNMTGTLTVQ